MELIDKDDIVAEIEKLKSPIYPTLAEKLAYEDAIKECKDIILSNSIKTKDVNLEKELDEWLRYGPHTNYPWCTIPDAVKITAEHFFELGLNVKGE